MLGVIVKLEKRGVYFWSLKALGLMDHETHSFAVAQLVRSSRALTVQRSNGTAFRTEFLSSYIWDIQTRSRSRADAPAGRWAQKKIGMEFNLVLFFSFNYTKATNLNSLRTFLPWQYFRFNFFLKVRTANNFKIFHMFTEVHRTCTPKKWINPFKYP